MSLMSRLLEWLDGPQERSMVYPPMLPGVDNWLPWVNFGGNQYGTNGFQQTLLGNREETPTTYDGFVDAAYKSNGIVFACMRARQALFSEARFRFRRVRNGKPGDLFGTPALSILEEPWPGATTGDLLSVAITDLDTSGNAYLVRRGGQIRRLRPSWVSIVMGAPAVDIDAEVIGYIYYPGGKYSGRDPETLLPETVAHWKLLPDPTDPFLRGLPWLAPVIREIIGDSATTNHKLKYFENGATPNLAVTFDAATTIEQAREWIELWKQDHEGLANAYKTAFFGGGSAPTPVGSDMKQIDFKSVQGAGETRIAAAAGVPPIVVGLSEGLASATYSNYGQARRAFADLTMRPLWRSFAGALATIIDVPFDAELWYDDHDISFLQEDVKDAAEIIKSQVSSIGQAVRDGFTADSAMAAVISGDLSQLEHTGLFSVQLQPPGTVAAEPELIVPAPKPTNGKSPVSTPVGGAS